MQHSRVRPMWRVSDRLTLSPRLVNVSLTMAAVGTIALAEVTTAFVDPRYGVIGHVAVLVVLLALGALSTDGRRYAFCVALSVCPLIRIVSLGMPLGHFPQLLWYILTGIPLFLAAFLIVRTLELPRHSLGLQMPSGRGLPIDLGVAASGIGLGLVEWWILRPEPLVQTASIVQFLGVVLILLVFTGFLEELLFRGLIQHAATGLLGPNAGLFLTAALFAILHVGWHSLPDLAFVFAVALYFGLTVRYTRSLLGVTIAHGATNVMLFVVLPLALP